jgi:superfamily I DNA/RNA helicase
MPAEKWFINESELDDYQYSIKELDTKRSFVIQGCAGSGKTILALWRAKELQESSKGSFFVLVFTKALRKFIEDGIREIGIDSAKVLYQWDWENRKNKEDADYFIIDEAQDFTLSELNYIKGKAKISVMIFGDTAQQLYQVKRVTLDGNPRNENTSSMPSIAASLNIQIRDLTFNYRLPKRIARYAEYINSQSDKLEPRCKKEGAFYPVIKKCSNNQDELNWIIQKIKDNNLKDVGILVPYKDNVRQIYEYFNQFDLNPECYFWAGNDSNFSLDFSTPNPKILTYHSAKGLQFQSVFLPYCEVNDDFFKNPLYVALTRTYERLYISYTNEISYYLSNVPKTMQGKIIYEDDNTQVLKPGGLTIPVQKEIINGITDDLPF